MAKKIILKHHENHDAYFIQSVPQIIKWNNSALRLLMKNQNNCQLPMEIRYNKKMMKKIATCIVLDSTNRWNKKALEHSYRSMNKEKPIKVVTKLDCKKDEMITTES